MFSFPKGSRVEIMEEIGLSGGGIVGDSKMVGRGRNFLYRK